MAKFPLLVSYLDWRSDLGKTPPQHPAPADQLKLTASDVLAAPLTACLVSTTFVLTIDNYYLWC